MKPETVKCIPVLPKRSIVGSGNRRSSNWSVEVGIWLIRGRSQTTGAFNNSYYHTEIMVVMAHSAILFKYLYRISVQFLRLMVT